MNKLIALAMVLVISPELAQAAHCRHGQLYRVSMHRCVGASSTLGQEIRPHRHGRYAQLETRHRFRRRGPEITIEDAPIPPEKPDTFVDILLPADGSLDAEAGVKTEESPNPPWPKKWDHWNPIYSPW